MYVPLGYFGVDFGQINWKLSDYYFFKPQIQFKGQQGVKIWSHRTCNFEINLGGL